MVGARRQAARMVGGLAAASTRLAAGSWTAVTVPVGSPSGCRPTRRPPPDRVTIRFAYHRPTPDPWLSADPRPVVPTLGAIASMPSSTTRTTASPCRRFKTTDNVSHTVAERRAVGAPIPLLVEARRPHPPRVSQTVVGQVPV